MRIQLLRLKFTVRTMSADHSAFRGLGLEFCALELRVLGFLWLRLEVLGSSDVGEDEIISLVPSR